MLALSAAVATISVVMLVALVVRPSVFPSSPVAAPAQPSAGPVATIAADARITVERSPVSGKYVDLSRAAGCADGATTLVAPAYLVIDGATSRIFIAHFDDRTGERIGRPVPVTLRVDDRTGWMRVTCATDDRQVRWGPVGR